MEFGYISSQGVTIQVEPLKGYNFSSYRGKIAYKLNPISFRYYAYT